MSKKTAAQQRFCEWALDVQNISTTGEHFMTASKTVSNCNSDHSNDDEYTAAAEQAEQETLAEACPCCRKKDRTLSETRDLILRLNRIEGQIRGIRRMVEEEAYCIDILTQVSAASCALNSFTKELLTNHIKTCVTDDIKNGKEDKVDELVRILPKLMK